MPGQHKRRSRKTAPIFYYNKNNNNEIKAGGVMFYYYNRKKNTIYFLMIKNEKAYEDFGGKTEKQDNHIDDTVCREVAEESNFIFTEDYVNKKIKTGVSLYTKRSKYLLYFCKLEESEYMNPTIFGNKEIYENINRTVEWIPYSSLMNNDFIKNKLNPRLKFKSFFTNVKNIYITHM